MNDPECDGNDVYNTIPISPLNPSAFVDIDADCMNDLIIMSSRKDMNYLEIWRGRLENNKLKFCLNKKSVYSIDNTFGHFTIADINRDGMLDLIFPIKGTSKVYISFNKIQLQFNWADDYCYKYITNPKNMTIPEVFDEFNLNPPDTSVL